jgi:methionine-rich copper-binding protein CopC
MGRLIGIAAGLALSINGGCAGQSAPASQESTSILASSSPAAGSTVRGPVEALKLHFDPPARLMELKVTGPDGTMPMMVHPVGEVPDYDLPLSDLGPGSYSVEWRATVAGSEYRGSFNFAVR